MKEKSRRKNAYTIYQVSPLSSLIKISHLTILVHIFYRKTISFGIALFFSIISI